MAEKKEGLLTISTIEVMKQMAADPLKSSAIVQDDTCLGGLVMVLSNPDWHIVKTALETLQRLADNVNHRSHMKNFLGMMDQLNNLKTKACPVVRELAVKVYEVLSGCTSSSHHHHHHQHHHQHSQHHQATQQHQQPSHGGPLRDTTADHNRMNSAPSKEQTAPAQKPTRRNSFFLGGVAKCKTITLQIKGIEHKDDIELCRNSLLTVSGVISITFDSRLRRAILRTKPSLKPELLAQAIARTMTMYAEQVIKDEQGKEMLLSFGKHAQYVNKENEELPDYPSDSDSPVRGTENMARMGGAAPPKDGHSWIKSMSSFLTNSFYW